MFNLSNYVKNKFYRNFRCTLVNGIKTCKKTKKSFFEVNRFLIRLPEIVIRCETKKNQRPALIISCNSLHIRTYGLRLLQKATSDTDYSQKVVLKMMFLLLCGETPRGVILEWRPSSIRNNDWWGKRMRSLYKGNFENHSSIAGVIFNYRPSLIAANYVKKTTRIKKNRYKVLRRLN